MKKGDRVVIVRGRKSRGEAGTVIWIGPDKFDEDGERVGIKLEGAADPVFVDADYVDVIMEAARPEPAARESTKKAAKESDKKTATKKTATKKTATKKTATKKTATKKTAAKADGPTVEPAAASKRNPELERSLVEDPEDEARYAVYADWLQEAGDPRGELIAAQLLAEDERGTRKAAAKQLDAYAKQMRQRLPCLRKREGDVVPQPFTWRWGFVDEMKVHNTHAPFLDELFDQPELLVLRALDFTRCWELKDLTPLAKLRALRSLDLGSHVVVDIAPITALAGLRELHFKTSLQRLPDLSALRHLEHLQLNGSRVNDVSGLAGLDNLSALQLAHTFLRDVETLPPLPQLKTLSLSNTIVKDVSVLARRLPRLEVLSLANTLVSDTTQFLDMSALEVLELNGTKVRDISPLREMTRLRRINLAVTEVSDISPLSKLTKLTELYVGKARVPQEQARALRKALPELKLDTKYSFR